MKDIPADHIVTYLGGQLHGHTNVLHPNNRSAGLNYSDGNGITFAQANRYEEWRRQTISAVLPSGAQVSRDFMVLVGWCHDPVKFVTERPEYFALTPRDPAPE
ncbi:hypothetical protein ACOTH1_00330 [Achromobacter ruhlandii]|uniref:hypothetical protein n=1 Tax=Achromobacter ruhlandii TaxID=72557 RepID=UPI003B9B4A81